jgi:hypothetical protein
MSSARVRLVVLVAVWLGFLATLYLGRPPRGHPVRPLLWATMVLLSLRVIYGAVSARKRRPTHGRGSGSARSHE